MDKLKAAFKEVMQPKEKRQLEDDALVKTMKVCAVHFFVHTYDVHTVTYVIGE